MIGSDPELFLKNADGKYISAIGIVGGNKNYPKPVKELGKGFFVQEDNVLLEFNTPPARSSNKWVDNHSIMLTHLNKTLEAKGLKIAIDASAEMPVDQLQDPRAHVFGCDPDFNVWTLKPNPRPHSDNPNLRSAGGHVHVAYKGTNVNKILLGRKLDLFLGLWSVIHDPDTRRRELYGKAGAIRFKPYGIEYRTLSNFWLATPNLTYMVWEGVERALKYGRDVDQHIADVINAGDKISAEELYKINTGRRGWF